MRQWPACRRALLLLVIPLTCTSFLSTPAFADTVRDAPDRIRVGIYDNPPKVFVDENGRPTGFWPELTRVIAREQGWEIDWVRGTWAEGLARLRNNRIDVMVDTGLTEPRRKRFAFNRETVHVSWSRIYAAPGVQIETIPDLAGKRIGGLEKSFNLDGPEGLRELLAKFSLEADVVAMRSYRDLFRALDRGQLDAGVTNRDFGNRMAPQFHVVRTPIIFQPAELRYAFTSGAPRTPELIRAFDARLEALKSDPESAYYGLQAEWLGGGKGTHPHVLPEWVSWLLFGLLAAVVLLAGGAAIIERRVRAKTRELAARTAELQQSRDLLTQSQRIARIGSWQVPVERDDIQVWSDEHFRILGVSRDSIQPSTEAFIERIHPDDRAGFLAEREIAVKDGKRHEMECRIVRPNGEVRHVRVIGKRAIDPVTAADVFSGTIQDITDTRLRDTRMEQFRRLIEGSPDYYFIVDSDDRFIMANDAYAALHGYDSHSIQGTSVPEIVGREFFDNELKPRIESCLAGQPQTFELQRKLDHVGRLELLVRYFPIPSPDGASLQIGGIATDVTELRETERELQAISQLVEIAGRIARLGGWSVDVRTDRVTWSDVVAEIHGMPQKRSATVEETIESYAPEDRERMRELYRRCVDDGSPYDEEFRIKRSDDTTTWVRSVGEAVFDANGDVVRVEGALQDISAQKVSELELAAIFKTRETLINSLPAHIAVLDSEGNIADVNAQWQRFGRDNNGTGTCPDTGDNYLAVCDAATGDGADDAQRAADGIRKVLDGKQDGFTMEYPCHSPETRRWFRMTVSRLGPDGSSDLGTGAVVMHVDITERKQAEIELNRLAFEDQLTGLASNTGFVERLSEILQPDGWQPGAVVVMISIRNQHDVNEAHGYTVGDQVIVEIAERLRKLEREGAIAGRPGGDEFVVFLPEREENLVEYQRDLLTQVFARSVRLQGFSVGIVADIGYTTLGDRPRSIEELMREAAVARLKGRVGDNPGMWHAFTRELDEEIHKRVTMTRDLQHALDNNEFELHMQPKVLLHTGEVVGAEALIRWRHPEKGLQSPASFIPVAEQSQLIGPIGDWVLREACRHLHEWRRGGLTAVRLSVNVSLIQFLVGDFANTVHDALESYELSPDSLTLEITESIFAHESENMHDQIQRLHDLGVRLSLDDFGTGYSSLLYLQRYPFSEIKLDQGFVRHMLDDAYSARIVEMVMQVSHALAADVVAEGIETAELRDTLIKMGCEVAQGYYFSMPLAAEDFVWLLSDKSRLPLAPAAG